MSQCPNHFISKFIFVNLYIIIAVLRIACRRKSKTNIDWMNFLNFILKSGPIIEPFFEEINNNKNLYTIYYFILDFYKIERKILLFDRNPVSIQKLKFFCLIFI